MKFWMLFTKCGECDEPIPFSPIDFIGYNPGTSGHLFHSRIEAEEVLELTKQAIRNTGYYLSTETCENYYDLIGPKLKDQAFWSKKDHCMIHYTGSKFKPVIKNQQLGVICNDDSVLNNVLAAEIEIKL